ncbi:MAG: FprA family A-type flavoprotein [Candidatus Zixiibacteriota bacterium]
MAAIAISDNIHWVGAKDPDLRIFDLYVKTTYGTTYNSYLLVGEKIALIDAVKDGFEDQLFDSIKGIIPIERIDYLIVNHNEPDHSGSINKLLELNPRIELICSAPAVPFLRNIINDEARPIRGVKGGEKLDLGGLSLEFVSAPFMHWPDTMFCYCPERKILFSCDGYAAHYCPVHSIFAKAGDPVIEYETWYYYDNIMRPFAPFSRRASELVISRDIEMVAPSHGPIIKENPKHFIQKYLDWTKPKLRSDKKSFSLFVASSYGNTMRMAESIAQGLSNDRTETHIVDAMGVSHERARDLLESYDGILFGTPTFAGDVVKPIWNIAHLLPSVSSAGKKAATFGSFGWGGQATEILEGYLEHLKLKVMKPGVKARLVPSQQELAACMAFGTAFAEFVDK